MMPYNKDDPATRRNVIDFSLLDFNMMFKFITVQEVLLPVLQQYEADKSFVPLDKILTNHSIIQYFQNVRQEPVWDRDDFEIFFEGHYDMFETKEEAGALKGIK